MPIHISANKLADFALAKTPQQRRRIVRELKRQAAHKDQGYAPYYMAFRRPAKAFLASGTIGDQQIRRAINRLNSRQATDWQKIDSKITTQAFNGLLGMAPNLRGLDLEFVLRDANHRCTIQFPDVVVTVTPDMLLHGERNGVPLIGSLRFYLAKDSAYQLGPQRAELVALMQYQWLAHQNNKGRTADATLCMVLECLQQRVTAAPLNFTPHMALLESSSRQLVRLWDMSDDEAAA